MASNIPQISLKTVDFNPTVFSPIAYDAAPLDSNIYINSLKTGAENRKQLIAQDISNSKMLMDVYEKLNPAEHEWFSQKMDDYNNARFQLINSGLTDSAFDLATLQARELAGDKELNDKMYYNASYKKALEDVKTNNKYNPLTKLYFRENNPYNFTGEREFKPTAKGTIVEDLAISSIQRLVESMTAAMKDSEGHRGNDEEITYFDSEGNISTDPSKLKDIAGSTGKINRSKDWSTNKEMKLYDQFVSTYMDLKSDEDINAKIHQAYKTTGFALDYYDKLRNDLSLSDEERAAAETEYNRIFKNFTNDSGIRYSSFEDWEKDKILRGFLNMEYEWTRTTEDNTVNTSVNSSGNHKASLNKATSDFSNLWDMLDQTLMGIPQKVVDSPGLGNETNANGDNVEKLYSNK